MPERFEFKVAPLVKASYAFEGDELIYRQGVRRIAIAIAHVNAFAVHERPPFFGFASTQLIVRSTDGRVRKTVFDASSPACRAALDALRARVPSADLTALDWPDAAARLGVVAYPWYESWLEPRAIIGIAMLAAASMVGGTAASTRDRAELFGQGLVALVASVIGIFLIASGLRRARKRRAGSLR